MGRAKAWGIERGCMLTAFKTPMGILCHCILAPLLLASTISHHSMHVCLTPSLSERISHSLLLQLLAASLLFLPSIPFWLCLLSYILLPILYHFLSSPIFFSSSSSLWSLWCLPVLNLPTVSFFYHHPPPSHLLSWPELLFPPSHSCLTHWRKRRSRIRCELNLPILKRWLRQPASVRVMEFCRRQRDVEEFSERKIESVFVKVKWKS